MKPTNLTPTPPPLATLLGGEEIEVQTNSGETLKVRVQVLPMRHRIRFIELLVDGDAQAIVELCCGWPPNYADRFTALSQDALFRKARDLNFTLAVSLLEQLNQDSKELAPLYQKVGKRMAEQMMPLLDLLKPALTPASLSAVPESRSSTSLRPGSGSCSTEKAQLTRGEPSNNSTQ